MKHYITIMEAAEICGVSARTVRNWIASNQLQAYSVGKRLIRIDHDEFRTLFIPMNGHLLNEARRTRTVNRKATGF
jgi:excisionase family DNA binding protein